MHCQSDACSSHLKAPPSMCQDDREAARGGMPCLAAGRGAGPPALGRGAGRAGAGAAGVGRV